MSKEPSSRRGASRRPRFDAWSDSGIVAVALEGPNLIGVAVGLSWTDETDSSLSVFRGELNALAVCPTERAVQLAHGWFASSFFGSQKRNGCCDARLDVERKRARSLALGPT